MRLTDVLLIYPFDLAAGWVLGNIWRIHGPGDAQHVLGTKEAPVPVQESEHFSFPKLFGAQPHVGLVAFGDSYSAGVGTGFNGTEDACRHGLGAYPQLIASDLSSHHGGLNGTSFQFLSCTGSTTDDVLSGGESPDSQVDLFNASLPTSFALLSIGGNDLGFFEVMNACIFRFYNFYSGTCETALEHARELLNSPDFDARMRILILQILSKARWEKKPNFRITVTGYARFFNDRTDACDDMSLGVWWRGPKLKRALRARMNAMVQAVNRKIELAVEKVNARFSSPRVLFVDYDRHFEGHRFCEPGVQEPAYDRTETYFFLVGGHDNARNGTRSDAYDTAELPLSMAHLVDPVSCLEPARRSGDWGELALCYMAMSKAEDPSLRLAHVDNIVTGGSWHVPTYYAKTFHPRSLGHEIIRDSIYEAWGKLER